MKKGIIAITLLLTGVLLVSPIANAISKKDVTESSKSVVVEKTTEKETVKSSQNEDIKDKEDKVEMTKKEAEAIVNKYIKDVEKSDFTYTYQGDENTFKAIKDKGMRGYVFLPNVDTDLAYLVDKDNGNVYYFHPSGYFELLQ
ncbi:hypothetical protein [Terrisporobacter sp.]